MGAGIYNESFHRMVDKSAIPTCSILGVEVAVIDMAWLLDYLNANLQGLSGDYLCVSNVHTTVTAYEDADYMRIQNGGVMAIPDGGPLSSVAHMRGYKDMQRTTGPGLMEEVFKISPSKGYRHYFYGASEDTQRKLRAALEANYPGIRIAGMYSPPFRPLTPEEDMEDVQRINEANPDFVWVGLGAPKQEQWMAAHQGRVKGLMIGVGAGFGYLSGTLKRAPEWMQKSNMEWFYRLLQEPRRLFSRYCYTNIRFIWNAVICGK